ncbi:MULTISPECIES: Nif3-like dinuclear metal center hexameric protein [unclassified Curtobacterium]|uniref:Nif3-like dinuclear metal center hexameric protein n=1 Tax=unclassified Curtobacterium TaxID=257496 RepID=UPI00104DA9BC|nr:MULTISPECIES: Nif3-like dinuclear metal center hexameric protein [unclassified Curtobacterium]TCL81149.1 dinuclear metal center YbgI/SA1388 family protein [Curtobacterium sp. PhB128]TCL99274.1 dinuclear metal center YbgI/SA1388 family protein [Curtobacterium sp. PhB138]TDW53214.1 dinuclear metal center YbgI/SA1388 family protein [Curtobacterium sp. PhB42]TDW58016.1 dinuclear metal center YbgI/SA1388 family protein [Curtobacterium sp. PhB190]TDW74337.1 dinuclear metal center YbgI/SA1388 fami
MPTLRELQAVIEDLWPAAGAESWDAVGLVAGDPDATVEHVHLAVDAVPATAREAVELGAGLLLTHHPLLLRGVTTIAESTYKGSVLATLVRGGSALIAAHTNADVVTTGTSAVLADRIGLTDQRPLDAGADPATGIGRVGVLAEGTTLGALARKLVDLLPPTATGVRVSGDFDQPVRTVALCAGAGDSLLGHPAVLAADVYITSDLRHHPASEFREQALLGGGPALIDTSHWATEWLWLDVAAAQLRQAAGVRVTVSDLRTDPWDFAVLPAAEPTTPTEGV